MIWSVQVDSATCFGIYFDDARKALNSHGELEIAKISEDGSILWQTSGAEIFSEAFALRPEFIEAVDFNQRSYRFSYVDGQPVGRRIAIVNGCFAEGGSARTTSATGRNRQSRRLGSGRWRGACRAVEALRPLYLVQPSHRPAPVTVPIGRFMAISVSLPGSNHRLLSLQSRTWSSSGWRTFDGWALYRAVSPC